MIPALGGTESSIFSRRYVRSSEHSPGCQLTSAAGEVSAWSPAARLRVVLLLQQDGTPPPPPAPGLLHGSFTRLRGVHTEEGISSNTFTAHCCFTHQGTMAGKEASANCFSLDQSLVKSAYGAPRCRVWSLIGISSFPLGSTDDQSCLLNIHS